MITCRRELLDRELEKSVPLMKGNVLDIGGHKFNNRGRFRPPLNQVKSWVFLNNNSDTHPDYCCDASKIPLDNQTFDTVVMTEVFEYLEKPELVLNEIYRLLTKNGYALISVPFLNPVHGDHQFDRQRWTGVKLEEFFRSKDFSIININPMGSVWSVIHDILHASTGYACSISEKKYIRIFQKFLHVFTHFFLKFDSKAKWIQNYINTGYFITLKK